MQEIKTQNSGESTKKGDIKAADIFQFSPVFTTSSGVKSTFATEVNVFDEKDQTEIRKMYQESIYESYFNLWQSDKEGFATDILAFGTTPKDAINAYAKHIAALTIKEWNEHKLNSIIIRSEGKIVGFALFGKDDKATATQAYYLNFLGVAPSHFKQKIGTQLMHALIDECQKMSAKENQNGFSMQLHTRKFNMPAIKLYRNHGFSAVEDISHNYGDKYVCYRFDQPQQKIILENSAKSLQNA